MKKKVIIIGAGVSGMSAGIYAQMNGYASEIYEQHQVSGGECTAWTRNGYIIDGAISWLTGTKPGTKLNSVWNEIGAFDNKDIVFDDIFAVIEKDNRYLCWYRDIKKLRKHLYELSPEDEQQIDELISMIRNLSQFEIPAGKPMDLMDYTERKITIGSFMKLLKSMGSISSLTVEEYVDRFHSPLIRHALRSFSFNKNLVQGVLITLASIAGYQSGWLRGGSKKLTDNMKEKYFLLGGQIHCNKQVDRICIRRGKAEGIILKNGDYKQADYIIPSCDVHITLKKLLQGKYHDNILDEFYTNPGYRTSSIAQVTFGVNCNLSKYPQKMIHIFGKKCVAGEEFESCLFTHYCNEKEFAPNNKSVIKTGLTIYHYENWENITYRQYQSMKDNIKNIYLELLYKYIPETKGKVEMVDVTTPLTYERYCNAYKGAYMAFMLTKETNRISHNGIINGIENLFIASQWLSALGGLPDAVISGKNAIQRVCNADKIEFIGVQ